MDDEAQIEGLLEISAEAAATMPERHRRHLVASRAPTTVHRIDNADVGQIDGRVSGAIPLYFV
jgi:hypothetical protein